MMNGAVPKKGKIPISGSFIRYSEYVLIMSHCFVSCRLFKLSAENYLEMIVTIVHVWVKPEHLEEFIRITEANHLESVKEPGNLRFDILQNANKPNEFALYEAYENESFAVAHKETRHYLTWRETVAPWMEKPREGVRYNALLP
jgi:autoinducer 2-degrading protein